MKAFRALVTPFKKEMPLILHNDNGNRVLRTKDHKKHVCQIAAEETSFPCTYLLGDSAKQPSENARTAVINGNRYVLEALPLFRAETVIKETVEEGKMSAASTIELLNKEFGKPGYSRNAKKLKSTNDVLKSAHSASSTLCAHVIKQEEADKTEAQKPVEISLTPPHNKNAKNPSEIYSVETLFGVDLLPDFEGVDKNEFLEHIEKFANLPKELAERAEHLSRLPEKRYQEMKALVLLDILRLFNLGGKAEYSMSSVYNALTSFQKGLFRKIAASFGMPDSYKIPKFRLNIQIKEVIVSRMIVLILLLDDLVFMPLNYYETLFIIDITSIRKIASRLGCVKPPRKFEKEAWVLQQFPKMS